jgi:hypothetical protein
LQSRSRSVVNPPQKFRIEPPAAYRDFDWERKNHDANHRVSSTDHPLLLAGTLILAMPNLLNYIFAIFLIVSGILGLGSFRWRRHAVALPDVAIIPSTSARQA